jgi:hypothetical protein
MIDEADFEGSLVLEQLAAVDKLDEFFAAIDADDTAAAERLMRAARVDRPSIAMVLRKMAQADGEH